MFAIEPKFKVRCWACRDWYEFDPGKVAEKVEKSEEVVCPNCGTVIIEADGHVVGTRMQMAVLEEAKSHEYS